MLIASMAGQGRFPRQASGDAWRCAFRTMQSRQENAWRVDGIGNNLAVSQLQVERRLDDFGRHVQQRRRHRHQLGQWQPAMALVHRFGERVADAGARPDHRRLLDAELLGDQIGALKPMPRMSRASRYGFSEMTRMASAP